MTLRADGDLRAGEHLVGHDEVVMGTVFSFDVALGRGGARGELHVALRHACALLHRLDALLSLWKPESAMSRYRSGALESLPCELTEVFERCAQAKAATDGWFDAEAMPGGMDPTGLVKGWAGQRALDILVGAGFPDAMVNAAGDVATSGGPGGPGRWRIGIQHPGSRAHLLGVAAVDGAIATSGCYERGPHLYDPFERRLTSRFASATVTGPDLTLADALATALAVAGPTGFSFVERLAGYEAVAMAADGTTRQSSGWRFAPVDV